MKSPERHDNFAGEAAWREWFDVCSVDGCSAETSSKLRAQIVRAMLAQLTRYGFSVEIVGDDDPIAFFDGYFKLKGSQEKPKPLKCYFAHRIAADGVSMFDFVCGTLFGSRSGRIHDIVLDWIATLKGWKAHSRRGADGKRHLEWEGAANDEGAALELSEENDPATNIEAEGCRILAQKILEDVSRKIKAEKSKVALLFYATAQDVSITDATVLEGLETEKSRAYAIREKAMTAIRKELKGVDEAGDPLFARMFLETCERLMPEGVLAKLGGAQ